MRHRISIHFEQASPANRRLAQHLRRCITAALREEGVAVRCEIDVLVTNRRGIRRLNREMRGVDRVTDVLSFPAFALTPGAFPAETGAMADPQTGLVPLGDMAICLPRARAQARAYGHTVRRETGYLTVHSVLHLLGYDHLDEGEEKRRMRAREEAILAAIALPRQKEARK